MPLKIEFWSKGLFIRYYHNTASYFLQNVKNRNNFASRNVRFNENILPGFQNETKDIADNFQYLDLDEVREELQD